MAWLDSYNFPSMFKKEWVWTQTLPTSSHKSLPKSNETINFNYIFKMGKLSFIEFKHCCKKRSRKLWAWFKVISFFIQR